jgi:hypothetical protein
MVFFIYLSAAPGIFANKKHVLAVFSAIDFLSILPLFHFFKTVSIFGSVRGGGICPPFFPLIFPFSTFWGPAGWDFPQIIFRKQIFLKKRHDAFLVFHVLFHSVVQLIFSSLNGSNF